MGKNRPIINNNSEDYVHGIRQTFDFFVKWIMVSAIFSYIAMLIWNNIVSGIFSLRSLDFIQIWGIFTLIALIRFAFYSFKMFVVRP